MCCAYVRKVNCAVVRSILDMTSFGSADSMDVRRASNNVVGQGLSQYFRWQETLSILYFSVISKLIDRSTTLPLKVFTQQNFVADFIRLKLNLI